MNKKIGIIGFGNMGSAIAESIRNDFRVFVFDKDKTKTSKASFGITIADNIRDLLGKVDVVVLAVKPQDFDGVLKTIKGHVKNKLIISIAAGKTTKYIKKKLGMGRVVRVMPNLPAKEKAGTICISKGSANFADLVLANYIFRLLGKTEKISEDMMDKATAVSGSGPGYYSRYCPIPVKVGELKKFENEYFIPNLALSATALGFPASQAKRLAKSTAEGSRKLLLKTKIKPAKLMKQVASKRGTTEAALKVFQQSGQAKPDSKVWIKAVKAAAKRAKELSKK